MIYNIYLNKHHITYSNHLYIQIWYSSHIFYIDYTTSTHSFNDFEFFKVVCNGNKWKFALKIFHHLYNSDGKTTVKIIEGMISDISTDNEELGNDIRDKYYKIIEQIKYQRMYSYLDSDSYSDSYSYSYSYSDSD